MGTFIINIWETIKKKFKLDLSGMDTVSSTATEHRGIGAKSGSLFMTAVSVYFIFAANGFDPIAYFNNLINTYVPSGILRVIIQIFSMLFTTGALYKGIEAYITLKRCAAWRKKNKDLWVKGMWLHIHDKKKIRVGSVMINQDFYSIQVNGKNLAINQKNLDDARWNHLLGRIVQLGNDYKIYGYYENKHGIEDVKGGMHTFTIHKTGTDEYPMQMDGEFRDLINNKGQEISNAVGRIYLYKLTPNCPYYKKVIDPLTGKLIDEVFIDLITDYMKKKNAYDLFIEEHPEQADIITNQFDETFFKYKQDPYLRKLEMVIEKQAALARVEVEKNKDKGNAKIIEKEQQFTIKSVVEIRD